jgi:hypothetical protein
MNTNVEVWREAARAADELIEGVHTLAGLIAEAAAKGSEIIHWSSARVLRKKRQSIPRRDTNLWDSWIGADDRPRVTLAEFAARPETADWMLFDLTLFVVANQVQGMSAEFSRQIRKFAAKPQIEELALSLARPQRALEALRNIDRPCTDEEWLGLKQFIERYIDLADALHQFNDAVETYVERLRADGRWPVRGD